MIEHKNCKGCNWNKYPLCEGIKMFDGNFMNIENLTKQFQCGIKGMVLMVDQSIIIKSKEELKLEDLEERIKKLEKLKL